jgi:hypothetical protein
MPETPAGSAVPPAPRPKSRKALWIVLGVVAFILLCIVAFAAFGFYFVANNVQMESATLIEASKSFDEVRARFKEAPIITLDDQRRVTLTRQPPAQPADVKPQTMHVMAYDVEDSKIVRVTVPFWMLRLGREKIRLGSGGDLQFEQLHITAEELERYGPALLVDHRNREGHRVLVWTQ